jgi:hypothetical protein
MSGMIVAPRHRSHPDCRAPLIQIDAPHLGESLLLWLKQALEPKHDIDEPEPEDWGWYAHLVWEGQRFTLGSSASDEEDGEREWVLQVVPQRSLKERLLGRGKVSHEHPLVQYLARVLSQEEAFIGVSVESAA